MAADLLVRRKTLLSGGVLTVTCNLLMAFASDLFTICFAMGLNALAMTMFSGTFTALVYDSLKTEGREDEYIQVSAGQEGLPAAQQVCRHAAGHLTQQADDVEYALGQTDLP